MLYMYVFVCAQWRPTHIVWCFCFVFLRVLFPMLPVSLDCPFLIAPSVFSNVYLQSRQDKNESMTSLVGNVLSALTFICMFFHKTTFPISSIHVLGL
jgi:hypothetical protein